jgi:hypothetical protein
MKLTNNAARLWFVPQYLPPEWQWPAISLMFYASTAYLCVRGKRKWAR